jgi:hypothetical protein
VSKETYKRSKETYFTLAYLDNSLAAMHEAESGLEIRMDVVAYDSDNMVIRKCQKRPREVCVSVKRDLGEALSITAIPLMPLALMSLPEVRMCQKQVSKAA